MLLQAKNISKSFGGVHALRGASLTLQGGEVHALVGENGAGKSTLSHIIGGSVTADSGEILLDNHTVSITNPQSAQRLGIAMIHQELDIFPHLTVGENIVIQNGSYRDSAFVRQWRIEEFCRPYLEAAGLHRPTSQPAGSLPIGELQLLSIARALSMGSRLLLMDEPTSSLSEDAVERLFTLIRGLRGKGVAIVYVSHKLDEIFQLADRMTVLRDGQTAGTSTMAETSRAEVIRLMVGREIDFSPARSTQSETEVLLAVNQLRTDYLTDISFELRRGEVLGIAGLVGAGRTELVSALFGIDRVRSGEIRLRGEPVAPRSPADAIRLRIGMVPEDRRAQGLMMHMSALRNATLSVMGRMQTWGFLHRSEERSAGQSELARVRFQERALDLPASALSGGNQQKTLIARCLLADPDLLLLDDPARGIDVGAKQDIYRIIESMTAQGKGVILTSSELPELMRCSDRILVLSGGRVTGLFDAWTATQEQVMAAATISSSGIVQ